MTYRTVRYNPLALKIGQPLYGLELQKVFWNYKKVCDAGTFNDPSDAINYMYQYHLQAAKVVDHRLHVNNKRRADETEAKDQEQYLTHYEPLIIENGLFVCLKPTKTESSSAQSLLPAWKMPAARSAVTQEHVRNTQNKEIYLPQICTNAAYATAPTFGHV